MLRCEPPPFILTDIGDEILQLAIIELLKGGSRFPLQRLAGRALRIMDLNDGGNAVADLGQIRFLDARTNFRDDIPTASTDAGEDESAIADAPQNITSIRRSVGFRRLGLGAFL